MGEKQFRVLIAVSGMKRGGVERVAAGICRGLAKSGVRVCLCITGTWEGKSAYALPEETDVFYSRGRITRSAGAEWAERVLRLRFKVMRFRPDVILGFAEYPPKIMLTACKGMRVPVIFAARNSIKNKLSANPGMKDNYKDMFPRLAGAVFQTAELQRQYNGIFDFGPGVKQTVIKNPAWESEYWEKPARAKNKLIMTAGRLVAAKDHRLLIDAFSRLPEKYAEWKLVIYGEGALRADLEGFVREKGLCERVGLPGAVSDIDRRMYEAGIFVLSSVYEGMPNALIEALCMGLACVSTDFEGQGARELIRDGENGIIVPAGDAGALSAAIMKLIDNPEYAEKIGQNAKLLRAELAEEKIVGQWMDFMRLAADGSRRGIEGAEK